MNITYSIFGRAIQIVIEDDSVASILQPELSLYPILVDAQPVLKIEYVDQLDRGEVIATNPSIHSLLKDGFIYGIGPIEARFLFENDEVKHIHFTLKKSGRFMTILRKWLNIQFATHKESIGQWIHEHVLVPYAFCTKDLAVIHASAVQTASKKTLVFGGTGGVGKTSLELALCLGEQCSFISDDICMIDSAGLVSPNLAYPKVYAYNVEGDDSIKSKIFAQRSLLDKFHFKLHELRGKKFSRRRISPLDFYGSVCNEPSLISDFFILFRDQSSEITFEKIHPTQAASLNTHVIFREYNGFFDHITWNQYNAEANDLVPNLDLNTVLERMRTNSEKGFSKASQCWLVRIPLTIPHHEFKHQMVEKLRMLGLLD